MCVRTWLCVNVCNVQNSYVESNIDIISQNNDVNIVAIRREVGVIQE